MDALEQRIKSRARALGFELAGIAPATPADGLDRLRDWLERGFAGTMSYMQRQAAARTHPSSILAEVRSVVMVGMNYKPPESAPTGEVLIREGEAPAEPRNQARQEPDFSARQEPRPPEYQESADSAGSRSHRGKVARYARGVDYHDVLRERLNQLLAWLQTEVPGCRGRGVVDTAPLLERDFARRAGLGWFGKNTMLLNRRLGSYFLIGALLLDLDLQPDEPHQTSHCGTCTACLDACPTQAFVQPGVLDSRRCLSYLTIELRGPVPEELRPQATEWLFGCDICQEVCPWNRKAPAGAEPSLQARPDLVSIDLLELFDMSDEAFRRRFKGTALWRARRRGLLRNAALILGNRGGAHALPALKRASQDHDAVVREAAQWAIERIRESPD